MRNGMEVMSLLYLRGAETEQPPSAFRSNTWTQVSPERSGRPGRLLLLYECVDTSLPGGHLKGEVRDGQRQLGGRRDRLESRSWEREATPRPPAHLRDDDGRQVFQVLDVGQQRVPQCVVGFRGQLVEGGLDFHLHRLSSKITRLHILFQLQQLVGDLPGVHLDKRASETITRSPRMERGSAEPARDSLLRLWTRTRTKPVVQRVSGKRNTL